MKENDFLVEYTREFKNFCFFGPVNEAKKRFDTMPIKEVREACLKAIDPDSDYNFNWLARRVVAYCQKKDFGTVCMLLRTLSRHQWSRKPEIVNFMVDAVRFAMMDVRSGYSEDTKNTLVILCGKLQFDKNLYSKRVRELFEEIIKKFYPSSVYSVKEEECRLVSRVLFIIAAVKDASFISILEEKEIDKKGLAHLMGYVSVCKEEINLEGLRLVILKHLKEE